VITVGAGAAVLLGVGAETVEGGLGTVCLFTRITLGAELELLIVEVLGLEILGALTGAAGEIFTGVVGRLKDELLGRLKEELLGRLKDELLGRLKEELERKEEVAPKEDFPYLPITIERAGILKVARFIAGILGVLAVRERERIDSKIMIL
jgi:hypothetical protein